jgi:predicted nucleic acid-binding protein
VKSLLDQLTARIRIVPAASYRHRLKEAHQLAPHPEDAPYLALALHLGIALWSNDADLGRQPDVVAYSTTKLLELLAR